MGDSVRDVARQEFMGTREFEKLPLMGILRGISEDNIGRVIETVMGAGLETVEITMNTPGADRIIRKAKEAAAGGMRIGAGTVLSTRDLTPALEAGAEFIVTPVFVEEVSAMCGERGIPVFPGALTPAEIFRAWNGGAEMVKVFPAARFGPPYMKEIKGPFRDIKLMAVGGVNLSNIMDFFTYGADAVAFGGSVFKKEWLERKDFASIRSLTADYVDAVVEIRDQL